MMRKTLSLAHPTPPPVATLAICLVMLIPSTLTLGGCHRYPGLMRWYQHSTRVTEPMRYAISDLSWSPNGRWLAMVRWDAVNIPSGPLLALDLHSGRIHPIAYSPGEVYSLPSWSPESDALLFSVSSAGIWTAPIEGGQSQPLSAGNVAAWNPVGSQIVVASWIQTRPSDAAAVVSLVDWDGSHIASSELARAPYLSVDGITWSPDGDTIVVVLSGSDDMETPGELALYALGADLAGIRELYRGSGFAMIGWIGSDRLLLRVFNRTLDHFAVRFRALSLTGECREFEIAEGPMGAARLSPDATGIAFVGSDGAVYVLRVEDVLGPGGWDGGAPCD